MMKSNQAVSSLWQIQIAASLRGLMMATIGLSILGVQSAQAATIGSSSVPWVSENAKSADSFVNSIGINTHLHYSNTVYARFNDLIKPKLLNLGVRHIRDGAYTYAGVKSSSFYYERLRDLASKGIRFNLVTSVPTRSLPQTDYRLLSQLYTWTNGSITSFEGVNEPDLNLRGKSNWFDITRNSQIKLYNTVRSDPKLKNVAVIAPSITTVKTKLPSLAAWSDYGNLHNYFGGRHPETTGWGGNGYGSIAWNKQYVAGAITGSKPIISTETGWYNALQGPNTPYGTPEDVVAKYMPRMFLSQFNSGIRRTYLYELIEQKTDPTYSQTFGLLRSDGSEKPAYKALKNLITVLKDPGAQFTPGKLTYAVQGDTTNLQRALFQKQNGDFYLALWLGEQSWDPTTKTRLSVASEPITLTFTDQVGAITGYQFNSNGSLSTFAINPVNNQLSLKVSDRLVILKASPAKLLSLNTLSMPVSSVRAAAIALDPLAENDLGFDRNLQAIPIPTLLPSAIGLLIQALRQRKIQRLQKQENEF